MNFWMKIKEAQPQKQMDSDEITLNQTQRGEAQVKEMVHPTPLEATL